MTKPIILTGDRPTGKLHIGHYVGSLKIEMFTRKRISMICLYFQLINKLLTDHAKDPQTIVESIGNVA